MNYIYVVRFDFRTFFLLYQLLTKVKEYRYYYTLPIAVRRVVLKGTASK